MSYHCYQTNTNMEVIDRGYYYHCSSQLAEEEDRLQDLMNIQELELEDSGEFLVQCKEYNMEKIMLSLSLTKNRGRGKSSPHPLPPPIFSPHLMFARQNSNCAGTFAKEARHLRIRCFSKATACLCEKQ